MAGDLLYERITDNVCIENAPLNCALRMSTPAGVALMGFLTETQDFHQLAYESDS